MIHALECGAREPRLGVAMALELAFGVPIADLFPGFQSAVTEHVMQRAAELDERVRHGADPVSVAKREFVEGIAKRARADQA